MTYTETLESDLSIPDTSSGITELCFCWVDLMKEDKMTEHAGIKTGFNCKSIPFEF